jgi:hypothetical protein
MLLKEIEVRFQEHAYSLGYTEKVVGDYAYTKSRKPDSPQIKMISAKHNKIQIVETGKESYEI